MFKPSSAFLVCLARSIPPSAPSSRTFSLSRTLLEAQANLYVGNIPPTSTITSITSKLLASVPSGSLRSISLLPLESAGSPERQAVIVRLEDKSHKLTNVFRLVKIAGENEADPGVQKLTFAVDSSGIDPLRSDGLGYEALNLPTTIKDGSGLLSMLQTAGGPPESRYTRNGIFVDKNKPGIGHVFFKSYLDVQSSLGEDGVCSRWFEENLVDGNRVVFFPRKITDKELIKGEEMRFKKREASKRKAKRAKERKKVVAAAATAAVSSSSGVIEVEHPFRKGKTESRTGGGADSEGPEPIP